VHPAATTPCLGVEHIGLAVEDIEAAMADLKGRGVVFRTDIIQRGTGLRIVFLDAPDGAIIELLERR
jgi:methylmalonyl-CoA/ethylmalonyl-CoA epimerase